MQFKKLFFLCLLVLLTCCFITCMHQPVNNNQVPELEIGYIENYTAQDLKINSLSARPEGKDSILFTLSYESGKDRHFSFFNPPAGNQLMYLNRKGIRKDKTQVSFVIKKNKLKNLTKISMRFSTRVNPESDRNFIYLNLTPEVNAFFGTFGVALDPGRDRNTPLNSVNPYDDVRFRNMSGVFQQLNRELIRTLWFNADNDFGDLNDVAENILEQGKNPGLGIRALHRQGITGKGITVAIIDQNICLHHPEFDGKIIEYFDVGCNTPQNEGSMHGPAVASLLVGNTIGTAPDADIYYVAAPSWTADAKYYADALEWIISKNQNLDKEKRIRAVSVSAAPSGPGSPFKHNNELWDKAVLHAEKEGILVLDCTNNHGMIGSCYYDPAVPEEVALCTPGFPGRNNSGFTDGILAPTSYRTQAEEYYEGMASYQYTGRGGLSWGIPYVTGVLALGWQVNPALSNEEIIAVLFSTAYKTGDGQLIINPPAFIKKIQAAE